jgi:hypothetical protein
MQLASQAPQMHNMYEAYRRMYDALDIKNIDAILPPPPPPAPVDPATENSNAVKAKPLQVFPQQDHEAHIVAHAMFLSSPAASASPQAFLLLLSHVQEHVGMLARDQVVAFFQSAQQEAMAQGQVPQQPDPNVIESAVAQQTGEIMQQIMPMIQPAQNQDPLVGIRQQELENAQVEIQRKMMNDQMDFQIDQAKLQQAYELAQQRQGLQENIADARNDVNIYRINTQAALSRNK